MFWLVCLNLSLNARISGFFRLFCYLGIFVYFSKRLRLKREFGNRWYGYKNFLVEIIKYIVGVTMFSLLVIKGVVESGSA